MVARCAEMYEKQDKGFVAPKGTTKLWDNATVKVWVRNYSKSMELNQPLRQRQTLGKERQTRMEMGEEEKEEEGRRKRTLGSAPASTVKNFGNGWSVQDIAARKWGV